MPRLRTLLTLLPALLLAACGGGGGGGTTNVSGSGSSGSGSSTSLGTVFAAAAGASHSAALVPKGAASGPALVWGDNTWGQIGDNTLDTPKTTPVALKGATLPVTTAWKAVAAGEAHTLAIRSDGTLWAWGRNDNGQLGNTPVGSGWATPRQVATTNTANSNWTAVAAGDAHSVAIKSITPQLWTWGRNAEGQLGLGVPPAQSRSDSAVPVAPTKLSTLGGTVTAANTTVWSAISAGGKHTMALRASDGQIYTWGDNTYGQLGQFTVISPTTPTQLFVIGPGTLPVVAMASGRYHSLAILNDHTLYGWGANDTGQVGDITALGTASLSAGIQIGTDSNWFAVAGGGAHTLGIKQDQTLWAWGSNAYGQLGDGTTTDGTSGPMQIGTSNRWVAVAAGRYHSMAIDTAGKLWVWGRNDSGQLGLGATAGPVLVPTQLP